MPRVAPLGKHVIVPAGKAVGNACFIKQLQFTGIGHHVVFPRTALEFGGEKGLVTLHGAGDVIDDAVVVHVPVREELGNVVNPEDQVAFVPK